MLSGVAGHFQAPSGKPAHLVGEERGTEADGKLADVDTLQAGREKVATLVDRHDRSQDRQRLQDGGGLGEIDCAGTCGQNDSRPTAVHTTTRVWTDGAPTPSHSKVQ